MICVCVWYVCVSLYHVVQQHSNNRKEVAISRVMESTVVNAICLSSLCSFSFSWKSPSPPSSSNSTFLRKHRSNNLRNFAVKSDSSNQNLSTAIRVTWLYWLLSLLIANKGTKFHPHCLRPGFLGPCPSRRPDFQSPWASLDLQNFFVFEPKSTQRTGMKKTRPGPRGSKSSLYIYIYS